MHAFLSAITGADTTGTSRLATTSTSAPSGWLARFLSDPWAVIGRLLGDLREWAIVWGPIAGPAVAFGVALAVSARRWWRHRCQQRLHTNARLITVLAPPSVDPAGAIGVWNNLVGLLRPAWRRLVTGQPHLACEYVFSHEGVRIQFWVPGAVPPGLVERAVEAAWPGAHTQAEPASPPVPITPDVGRRTLVTGGELRLARSEALPIRSEFPSGTDPLRALLGALVGLGQHERACVQVLARPVTGRRVKHARRAARRLHTGGGSTRTVGRMLDAITPGVGPTRSRSNSPVEPQMSLEYAAQNRAVVAKQRGSQYDTTIRYAVAAEIDEHTPAEQVRRVLDHLRGRAHAIASGFGAFTDHNHYRRVRLRHPLHVLAQRRLDSGDLLSVPELAGLAHLPTDEAAPGVHRAGARAVAPPPGVLEPGPGVKPLGVTDAGHARAVGLRVADARHHLHVLGATGSGKSTLLANLVLADADAGRGAVVVDPKGDLVIDILSRLPERLGKKVVLFDASDPRHTPCLNPLDGPKHRTVDNLVSVFSRVFAASWGPRTDDILRAGALSLHSVGPEVTHDGPATLAHLPRLLSDAEFRRRIVGTVTDPVLIGFWGWYDELSDPTRAQVIAPLMNKLRAFLLRPFVRCAIASGPSTVDIGQALDSGGLVLARIPKGVLGDETASLVGSLLVAATWQAATRRARVPQRLRRDASLIVDECHNFLHMPYSLDDMLAEARGYRLSIVLAHQHLSQLPKELEEGISTNARTKIYFNASPEDAKYLARHTVPRLSEHDLAHLGAFHAAVRPVLRTEEAEPFTIRTQPLPPAIPGRAKLIRAAAIVHAASADTITTARKPLRSNTSGAVSPSVIDPRADL
jgi:hypothetical protein